MCVWAVYVCVGGICVCLYRLDIGYMYLLYKETYKNEYMYIYICHPHTDCFVVAQLFSVARHARFPKLGSKPG